jgi:hypothetical protein
MSRGSRTRLTARPLVALAAAWFTVAGATGAVMAVLGAWTLTSAGMNGCVLLIGDRAVRFPVPADAFGCTQRVDVLPIVLGALLSLALLATAGWLTRRRDGRLAAVVPFGAVAAVLAGLQPLMAVLWLVEQGNLTAGPIELAIGIVPLAWAFLSAAVALTAWRPRGAAFAS